MLNIIKEITAMKSTTCELVNTYEILEHVMGMKGLHPHSLKTIERVFRKMSVHTKNKKGIVLDIGCGSGYNTFKLSKQLSSEIVIIGIDINEHAIREAEKNYSEEKNLRFYCGDLNDFYNNYQDLSIIGIISISTSMFIQDIKNFYKLANTLLEENGIFIDLPFVFREKNKEISESFKVKTYAVCGCSMKMYTIKELSKLLNDIFNKNIDCHENEFELMNLKKLFNDYSILFLLKSFSKNILRPGAALENVSSWYLFKRTLYIFWFFMRNKQAYGAAELLVLK